MVPANSSMSVSDPKAMSLSATHMIKTANVQYGKNQRITTGRYVLIPYISIVLNTRTLLQVPCAILFHLSATWHIKHMPLKKPQWTRHTGFLPSQRLLSDGADGLFEKHGSQECYAMNGEREGSRIPHSRSNSSSLRTGKVLWRKWLLSLDQKNVFEWKSKHLHARR